MSGVEKYDSETIYKTQSLYEASFLLCRGHSLKGKEKNGSKYFIVFEGNTADKDALDFYNGAKAEAKKLFDNYRTLKDYIFEK